MNYQKIPIWIYILVPVALLFLIRKKRQPGGIVTDGAGFGECDLSDRDAKAIAGQLVNLLVDEHYVSDADEQQVKTQFLRIRAAGECGYQKVYTHFGYQRSTSFFTWVQGDLDEFMRQRVSEQTRAACRVPGSSF